MDDNDKHRRQVVQSLIAGGVISGISGTGSADQDQQSNSEERPNVLLLCGEDVGPHIHPYDSQIETPNIEGFASESLSYDLAYSNNPICGPARTTLATGMYANSIGAQNMRSSAELPDDIDLYHQTLAENGYSTVNHGKTDYNVQVDDDPWTDEETLSSVSEPFFMKHQFNDTHEGSIFDGVQEWHEEGSEDYADIDLPEYYPETDLARVSLGVYYEQLQEFDAWVGERIQELKDSGHWEDTIVIIWGDHGPGLPRGKRSLRDLGTQVPVIAYVPPKYRESLAPEEYEPGSSTDRPIGFVDFAPTFLSLAGIEPPEHMQGEPFMGEYEGERKRYLYGFKDRADERIDMSRSVRDERFHLIRNYMPHRIYGQHNWYLFQNPMVAEWRYLAHKGEISPEAASYFQEKPPVELYDLENDPEQINNLAEDPNYQDVRERLVGALHDWQEEIQDTGFLPEDQVVSRPKEAESPYEFAQSDQYNLTRIRAIAEQAARPEQVAPSAFAARLDDDDPAVRYWAATGLLIRHDDLNTGDNSPSQRNTSVVDSIRSSVETESDPTTRVVLAETLARITSGSERTKALQALISLTDDGEYNPFISLAAWNSLDKLDGAALPVQEELEQISVESFDPDNVLRSYANLAHMLKQKTVRDLSLIKEGKSPATWDDWPINPLPWG